MKYTIAALITSTLLGLVMSLPTYEPLTNRTTTVQRAFWNGQEYLPYIDTTVQF